MKSIKNSFLFFLFVANLFVISICYAQQPIDSLEYYKRKINQVQSSGDLENAYKFFQKYLRKSELYKNQLDKAYALYYIAKIENIEGFYFESEVSAVKALEILDLEKKSDYVVSLKKTFYNQFGKLYKTQKNYTRALEMYGKSLELAESAHDSMVIYNNISNVLKEDKQFKKAELELQKAYSFFKEVNDSSEKARVLDNLGFIKFKLEKEEGLLLMQEALELRKSINTNLYTSYKHLSTYYKKNNDLLKAIDYAKKAYQVANSINSASYREDALRLRVDLKDYSVLNEYLTLRDSISLAKQLNSNKFALIKYNLNQSELETQKARIKNQQYQFIVVLIAVFAILLFFLLKSRHKKEKLLQVYNTETRISKKVHDEVANDVYQVMTKLQATPKTNEEVLDDLEKIYIKTRDISKENSAIDVKQSFEELLKDLLLSYKDDNISVLAKSISNLDWNTISEIKKTAIYRVLQELMTNMKKHSKATVVVIGFNKKGKKIEIDYNDNGIGCTLKKHNGLQNAENRMQSVNGKITFESSINNGFKAKIVI